MSSGAFDRRTYSRMNGAKYPPAPATSCCWKGMGNERAHIASEIDCCCQPMVSTRSCTPDSMWLAATIAVEPPTEPAVCTRNSGLPTAPRASAR